MRNIGIIGAGQMGSGIAWVCSKNNRVYLIDKSEEQLNKSKEYFAKQSKTSLDKKILDQFQVEEINKNILWVKEIDDYRKLDVVIEAVYENLELKQQIFSDISKKVKDDCLLASNTSGFSINLLAKSVVKPERFMGVHFMNPVPIMSLVELIEHDSTQVETKSKFVELLQSIGKEPIVVKDSPAFLVNRLLLPMINEAIKLLEAGICSKEDIDKGMKLGANHPMGPLMLADFIGLDVCLAILENLYNTTGRSDYAPSALLRKYVTEGKLGKKSKSGFYDY